MEYLPSESIRQITDLGDPVRWRYALQPSKSRHKYADGGQTKKIKYVTKTARISNGWKKWKGEMEGLKKKAYEKATIWRGYNQK